MPGHPHHRKTYTATRSVQIQAVIVATLGTSDVGGALDYPGGDALTTKTRSDRKTGRSCTNDNSVQLRAPLGI
jgi:hypothetical protein